MWETVRADLRAILKTDPAVRSLAEAILCYPGLHALVAHRINHFLWARCKLFLIARILSQIVRFMTGVEIHPGAQIGKGVFIDHGMGVVIGETAQVGDNVVMHHNVTLGGRGNSRGKRHPTVLKDTVIGANATLLGPITVGPFAKIGAGAIVLEDVPPNTTSVGTPQSRQIPASVPQ